MIKEDLSISDLMSGMMMVFLLIAVVFMLDVQQEKNAMGEIALMAEQSRLQLNHDLMQEFAAIALALYMVCRRKGAKKWWQMSRQPL
jgi:succinate dehydrogenase hydrophobic anchor subunit